MVIARIRTIVIPWTTQILPPAPQTEYKTIGEANSHNERQIMLGMVILILLILMLVGAFPTWPHSRSWGYYPSGGLGLALAVVVVLLLLGRL
jgi:hypothetical protein